MFDNEQLVQVKWSTSNKKHFQSLGYKFSKIGDIIEVQAKDLTKNSRAKVKVKCDYCGKDYICDYCTIANDKYKINACGNCAIYKANDIRKNRESNIKMNKLKEICEEKGYILLDNKYYGCNSKIRFICKRHGEQEMALSSILNGHECFECSYEKRGEKMKYSAQEVKEKIENVNGNKWLNDSEYKNTICNNLVIQCSCGNTYTVSLHNYLNRHQNRCKKCSDKESVGELRIREILEEMNVEFIQEMKFPDCCDKRALPFDFYLPKQNMCIEFDGQQHYEPVYSNNQYLMTKRHDSIKNEFCERNNIKLLRIPYYCGNNIIDIIQEQVKI